MATHNEDRRSISEVKFANHIFEFVRFYDRHRLFCDEISGMKERLLIENGKETKFRISATNFHFGIKKLGSFVLDNLHYINDSNDKESIEKSINELENSFLNDTEYLNLSRIDRRDNDQEYLFQNYYFKYLLDCFTLSNRLSTLLQSSLMIGTKDINKKIMYHNDKAFFENLSRYRDEMSDDLANFKISNLLSHTKKVIGYYYSYKILISLNDANTIDLIIKSFTDYVLSKPIINIIIEVKRSSRFSTDELDDIQKETFKLKYVLGKIYYMVNKSLSEKNVLPKIQQRILVDRTTI